MRFFLFVLVILLFACGGGFEKRDVVRAEHDSNKNVPAIDDMIVSLKKEYIESCYTPVLKRLASDAPRPCETALFQMLERRYSMNYTQEHVDMAADELFFRDVRERLEKKLKTDKGLKRNLSRKFRSMDEIMEYYKPKYTFRKVEAPG
jgi:hypothetical protein